MTLIPNCSSVNLGEITKNERLQSARAVSAPNSQAEEGLYQFFFSADNKPKEKQVPGARYQIPFSSEFPYFEVSKKRQITNMHVNFNMHLIFKKPK